ncbi:LPS assembly lipoprotein LptE [Candidatus Endomicrobiellum devescovinae]|uniref:LPS assembly lipoprotein LptE n=1 Tax=Candidatus Endomicrobiellum devescovinae TaxID=3242322 RepID=UPI00281820F6|nr:LPS assembly lipoprotein LptE [Endomicrobium sp.]
MKKIIVYLFAAFLFISLSSCTSLYEPAVQLLPEHIKKVYVKPFGNNTNQFGIESKFTNEVIEEIINSGRLSLVNKEKDADGVLTVTIKRYILQPLTYDINNVAEQYKMWIIASVSLVDNDNNVTLWTEPNMEGIQIYRDINRRPSREDSIDDGMSEEEAREIVWIKMSRNIVRRVIKGFGSATSISEKKVPVQ